MDLTEQSPLRVHLVTGGDGTQALLLAMHYIAVDEWSVVPLLGDLMGAYAAGRTGGTDMGTAARRIRRLHRVVAGAVGDPEDPTAVVAVSSTTGGRRWTEYRPG